MPKLYIPKKIDIRNALPESIRKYSDYAAYLIHRTASRPREEFVRINAAQIRSLFPSKTLYTKIKNILVLRGILECDAFYRKGEKSLGYRVGPNFLDEEYQEIEVTNKLLLKKLTRLADEELPDHLAYIRNNLQRIEVEDCALPRLTVHEIALKMLMEKDLFVHQDRYGRVHTNLTNLKSEYRKKLKVGNRKLVNIDIRNSQPLMLCLALKERRYYAFNKVLSSYLSLTNRCPLLDDFDLYSQLCEEGRFYDYLIDQSNFEGNRKAFKVSFFGSVFFCKNRPNHENCALFKRLFPSVYQVVTEIKKDDHSELAKLLQRVESDFVINRVLGKCMREMPEAFVSTIHDSLMVEPGYSDLALQIFKDEFQKTGIEPTFSLERYE